LKSFLSEINVFDIESERQEIGRIFEKLNGEFENEYLNMIADLDKNDKLSEKSYSILLQFIPNLIARSDSMRELITELLQSDVKHNILKMFCEHRAKSFADLEKQDFFRVMAGTPTDGSVVNRALIFFTEYLFNRTAYYDIVIIRSQEGKPWITSDNPVVFENQMKRFEIMGPGSEVYFPLNPDYLIYLHYPGSENKENPLRKLENNTIHLATDRQNWDLQQKIMRNANNYVIMEGEMKYRLETGRPG
jgi:hypothetical protein